MKKKYERIMEVKANGYRIQVNRNSSCYIVKVGTENMNNYDKKAMRTKCYELVSLKEYLENICSLKGIDWARIENQLNKEMKSVSEGDISIVNRPRVEKGGKVSNGEFWDLDKISDYWNLLYIFLVILLTIILLFNII